MEHITVGKKYNEGKVAFVECVRNDSLKKIQIKNECFWLLVLTEGTVTFEVNGERISAVAPCFVCFDERFDPKVISKRRVKCFSVYFHPMFLNVNMSFELIRSGFYGDIAHTHDMFLLRPFLENHRVVPICENYLELIDAACKGVEKELREQRDWYWSCRGRSYFMEIIIVLERMYGIMGRGINHAVSESTPTIKSAKLKEAVLYIEGHYFEDLTLAQIAAAGGLSHTTLTALLKEETGLTAMEYLMNYRIKVAKKQLAFTEVPIKDITSHCGFKTVQHFSRVFKAHTGKSPADYRKSTVQKRRNEMK